MGKRNFDFNWLILFPAILLITLGLVTLLSIDTNYFYQQCIFAFIGFVAFFIFARFNFSTYYYLDRFILAGSIVFLLLSYLGPNIRGATRWLTIGSLSIQPSEIVKPFFLVSISSLMIHFPPTKIIRILGHFALFLVVFGIVLKQPDLGSALVYASMWLTVILMAGIPLRYVLSALVVFGFGTPMLYQFLHQYQKLRIITFLNPLADPQGAGYNAIQSMIAVGSGNLFGRGFGRGTQSLLRFLPERHTDFIFASFSEEFGFVGGMILLGIFFFFLMQILKQAQIKTLQKTEFLFISGFFMQLFTHVAINTGMNMGILPITGITLPFVSYGGSSILATCIGLGMTIAALQKTKVNF